MCSESATRLTAVYTLRHCSCRRDLNNFEFSRLPGREWLRRRGDTTLNNLANPRPHVLRWCTRSGRSFALVILQNRLDPRLRVARAVPLSPGCSRLVDGSRALRCHRTLGTRDPANDNVHTVYFSLVSGILHATLFPQRVISVEIENFRMYTSDVAAENRYIVAGSENSEAIDRRRATDD